MNRRAFLGTLAGRLLAGPVAAEARAAGGAEGRSPGILSPGPADDPTVRRYRTSSPRSCVRMATSTAGTSLSSGDSPMTRSTGCPDWHGSSSSDSPTSWSPWAARDPGREGRDDNDSDRDDRRRSNPMSLPVWRDRRGSRTPGVPGRMWACLGWVCVPEKRSMRSSRSLSSRNSVC